MPERLYRSRTERVLFGVAGGMARYFRLDPSIVRLLWVLLVLAGGAGILLYIVAAFVIPEEPAGAGTGAGGATGPAAPAWSPGAGSGAGRGESMNPAIVLGAGLILIGGWFLLQRFIPALDASVLWPFVLVGLGAVLLLGAMRRS